MFLYIFWLIYRNFYKEGKFYGFKGLNLLFIYRMVFVELELDCFLDFWFFGLVLCVRLFYFCFRRVIYNF